MKKIFHILGAVCAALTVWAGAAGARPLKVVATVFPIHDWTRQIAGDVSVELTLLYDSGADLHNYQPSAGDLVRVAGCDLFISVGGPSDKGLDLALSGAVNEKMAVFKLLAALGRDLPDHDHDEHDHDHEDEEDEHVWLSLRDAAAVVPLLAEQLAALDAEHAEAFRANAAAYAARLKELDSEYAAMVAGARCKTVIFAGRFPFANLCRDYGLDHYAAFHGCSAESEASFQTIATLAGKLRELNLPALLTIESDDGRIAETVRRTAGSDCAILQMNSLQSCGAKELAATDYLDEMRKNLAILRQALN